MTIFCSPPARSSPPVASDLDPVSSGSRHCRTSARRLRECQNRYAMICHICLQIVCQRLCQNSVSGWGSLEEKECFKDPRRSRRTISTVSCLHQGVMLEDPLPVACPGISLTTKVYWRATLRPSPDITSAMSQMVDANVLKLFQLTSCL